MKRKAVSSGERRRTVIKWSLFVAVLVIAIVIDLLTKHLAEQRLVLGEVHEVLPFFSLQRTQNAGVAFGLFGGRTGFIIAANVVALIVISAYVFMERRIWLAGISGGMIVGGSLGNLVQRVTNDGLVTDFLKLPSWPNFNMADVFLDVGIAVVVIGLIVELVRSWRKEREETRASR